jgi:hypothetical protein
MRRVALASMAGLVVLLTGACSDGAPGATEELQMASARVHDIKSGDLYLTFRMSATGSDGAIGFSTQGPFSFAGASMLPVADLRFTQELGTTQMTTRFVSDGTRAVAIVNGKTEPLSPAQLGGLDGFAGAGGSGALPGMDLDRWFSASRVTGEGSVGGDTTEVIEGDVDGPEALNGLLTVTAAMGGPTSVPALEEQARAQLQHAIRQATARVEVGTDDGLLRRVLLNVDLGIDPSLAPALASLAGGQLTFDLTIANPNEPVMVRLPP